MRSPSKVVWLFAQRSVPAKDWSTYRSLRAVGEQLVRNVSKIIIPTTGIMTVKNETLQKIGVPAIQNK